MSEAEQAEAAEAPPLLAQVREAYGRVAYTHKTHEKQADLCFQSHRRQQRLLVGLTVLSSGTFLAALLGIVLDESGAALVTSFVALLVSGINLGTKTFKYGEETQKHRDVAARLWNLRESYQSLIVDMQSEAISPDDARGRRELLRGGRDVRPRSCCSSTSWRRSWGRLAVSDLRDRFVLKGGVLLAAFDSRRPTRDVDLAGLDLANDAETVLALVRSIVASPTVQDDGVEFLPNSATAEVIREEDEYSGVRVSMGARLASASLPFHVDVNVGDPIWPAPSTVEVRTVTVARLAVP